MADPSTHAEWPWLALAGGRANLATGALYGSDGEVRRLRERERRLLAFFASQPDQTFSQQHLLTDVWGYDARVMSRTVYTTVQRLRRQIEPHPARPVHILTVRGEGYRFVPASAPTAATVTQCAGRESELSELAQRFEQGEALVTLLGPPGIGKTCVASRITLLLDVPAITVDLASAATLHHAVQCLGTAFGVESPSVESLGQDLRDALVAYRKQPIVVLDSVEHLVGQLGPAIAQWARDAPTVRFLVTSQIALGVRAESVLMVGPLPQSCAVRLLARRARAHGHSVGDACEPALVALADHLDGNPLALALAASRMRVLSPNALLDRLRKSGTALLRCTTREPRHQAWERVLERAWRLLPPALQAAAAQCALFDGPFDLDAFEAVVHVPHTEPLELLEGLRDHSWVRPSTQGLHLHGPLRPRAQHALPPGHASHDRHLAWVGAS